MCPLYWHCLSLQSSNIYLAKNVLKLRELQHKLTCITISIAKSLMVYCLAISRQSYPLCVEDIVSWLEASKYFEILLRDNNGGWEQ